MRKLDIPAARALADLASILDDLQTVLRCCQRLITELATDEPDDLTVEALWTTAVLSYSRCFADGRGLTEEDVTRTSLQGEVLEWHKVLRHMRDHYADGAGNPREQFSVGAAQGRDGKASGIAITATPRPTLDDVTVRQTGALAYALSRSVDQRISADQERVRAAANAMSKADLDKLPFIELTGPPDDLG